VKTLAALTPRAAVLDPAGGRRRRRAGGHPARLAGARPRGALVAVHQGIRTRAAHRPGLAQGAVSRAGGGAGFARGGAERGEKSPTSARSRPSAPRRRAA